MKNNRNINILFNALIMNGNSFGYATVITSYLHSLSNILTVDKVSNIHVYIVCQKRAFYQFSKIENYKNFHFIVLPNINNVFIRSLIEQIFLNVLAIFHHCAIVHMPATLGLIFCVKKQLLFFHATTTFMLPRQMHGRSRFSTLLQNLIIRISTQSADILTVTAKTSAYELFQYTKKSREFITIGDGVKTFSLKINPSNYLLKMCSNKFLLYVSSFYNLKNQKLLINCFLENSVLDQYNLILVGGRLQKNYFDSCSNLAKDSNNIFILDNINDDELGYLYKMCELYINPSLFEGFSLSPLEALSFGKPILLSDIPVHREIYGDDFNYFSPDSIIDLPQKIVDSLNYDYKAKCASISTDLLMKYTWDNFAKKNLQIYKDMVLL